MPLSSSDLRDICWHIGTRFPPPLYGDFMSFVLVHPRQAFLHWNVGNDSINAFTAKTGDDIHGSRPVVRVFDVTDILFDGTNAHSSFDIEVSALTGNYYLGLGMQNRNLIAEIGLRLRSGKFHAFVRSNLVSVDRDRRAGASSTRGLFVGTGFRHMFPVENVFEASSLAPLNRLLAGRRRTLNIAAVKVCLDQPSSLDVYTSEVLKASAAFGVSGKVFSAQPDELAVRRERSIVRLSEALSSRAFERIAAAHGKSSFSLVHCHDWYSWLAGRALQIRNEVPLVLTLHSTEVERAGGEPSSPLSRRILALEQQAARTADRVVAATEPGRDVVTRRYGVDQRKVTVIPDAIPASFTAAIRKPSQGGVLGELGLRDEAPVVLYCGEISHANGADLLVSAILRIGAEHAAAQFVFAGDGPLKAELQVQAAGVGKRCLFTGDVPAATFEALIDRCDFVVIPARTLQDDSLAQQAIKRGRPVLVTHQAHIACISHGRNGLLVYDNPGSIEWGLKEMLSNNVQGGLLRFSAGRTAAESPSLNAIAARYAVIYHELAAHIGRPNA